MSSRWVLELGSIFENIFWIVNSLFLILYQIVNKVINILHDLEEWVLNPFYIYHFFNLLFLEKCTETINKSKHHLLKTNRLHCIALLSKSQKGLEIVSSLSYRAKNKLEMFAINCTDIRPNLILILPRTPKKQSKV